jgi:hypothetical protein
MSTVSSYSKRHNERHNSAPAAVGRLSTSEPFPKKLIKPLRSQSDSAIKDRFKRKIYVVGEVHKPGTDFREWTNETLLRLMKKHYNIDDDNALPPIIFSEYAMKPEIYYLPDQYEDPFPSNPALRGWNRDSYELNIASWHMGILHHICIGEREKWNHLIYLQKIVDIRNELMYTYEYNESYLNSFFEYFIKVVKIDKKDTDKTITEEDIQGLNDAKLAKIKKLTDAVKVKVIHSIEKILKLKEVQDDIAPFDDYIKAHLDNVRKECSDPTFKLWADDNFSLLRDYSNFRKIDNIPYASLQNDIPFIILVGNLHLQNWRKLLKHYKNVEYIRLKK